MTRYAVTVRWEAHRYGNIDVEAENEAEAREKAEEAAWDDPSLVDWDHFELDEDRNELSAPYVEELPGELEEDVPR